MLRSEEKTPVDPAIVKKLSANIIETIQYYSSLNIPSFLQKITPEYVQKLAGDPFKHLLGQINVLLIGLSSIQEALKSFAIGKRKGPFFRELFKTNYDDLDKKIKKDLSIDAFLRLQEIDNQLEADITATNDKLTLVNRQSAVSATADSNTLRRKSSKTQPIVVTRTLSGGNLYNHSSSKNPLNRHSSSKPSTLAPTPADLNDDKKSVKSSKSTSKRTSSKKGDRKSIEITQVADPEKDIIQPEKPKASIWLNDALLKFAIAQYKSRKTTMPTCGCKETDEDKLATILTGNKKPEEKQAEYNDYKKRHPEVTTLTSIINDMLKSHLNKSQEHWVTPIAISRITADWKEYSKSHSIRLFFVGSKEVNTFIKFLENEKDLETVRTMIDYFSVRKEDTIKKIIDKNRTMVEAVARPVYGVPI